jgi:hypothetical protein
MVTAGDACTFHSMHGKTLNFDRMAGFNAFGDKRFLVLAGMGNFHLKNSRQLAITVCVQFF